MGTEGGRLASIGIAGLMICLVDTPRAAFGHGEAETKLTKTASYGSAVEPNRGKTAIRTQAIAVAQASTTRQVVPAGKPNEVDRAASNDPFRTRTTGATAAPIRRMAPAIVAATDSSIWDETSLIGKIFVVFGALLTIASAARMFFA